MDLAAGWTPSCVVYLLWLWVGLLRALSAPSSATHWRCSRTASLSTAVLTPPWVAAVIKINAEAGLGAFYAGLCPTLVGMLPYSTCYYFMYDAIKCSYCRANKNTSLLRPELLVGVLSGLTSSTISFPLEVTRKRLMVGAIQGKCPTHMFAALSEVLREEGVAGLYRGWVASCLKVMPTSGITWMFYEAWKDVLLVNKQLPNF